MNFPEIPNHPAPPNHPGPPTHPGPPNHPGPPDLPVPPGPKNQPAVAYPRFRRNRNIREDPCSIKKTEFRFTVYCLLFTVVQTNIREDP